MRRLLPHLVGDYLVQNEWMARTKVTTGGNAAAAAHGAVYAACFLPLTRDPRALLVIGGTHAVIDRYRLARYVVWARNQVAPAEYRYSLAHAGPFGQRGRINDRLVGAIVRAKIRDGQAGPEAEINERIQVAAVPVEVHARLQAEAETEAARIYENDWLNGWLLYIADNTLHLLINEWALARWGR